MICRVALSLALVNLGLLCWMLARMRRQRGRTDVVLSVLKVLDARDRPE